MKKLSKLFLSICITLIISFSLVGCMNTSDDNDSNDNGNTITVTQIAKDLFDNHNITSSYIASSVKTTGTSTEIEIIKYTYADRVAKVAVYDTQNNMTAYYEFETVVNNSLYKFRTYNLTTKKYTEETLSYADTNAHKANLYLADKAILFLYQAEINSGYDIGDNVPEFTENGLTITESIKNPSGKKYTITRRFSGIVNDIEEWQEFSLTCENNKTLSLSGKKSDGSVNFNVGYEYCNVTIEIDTSTYTKIS